MKILFGILFASLLIAAFVLVFVAIVGHAAEIGESENSYD